MSKLDFADLTDTDFKFSCYFAGDGVDYWDYDFCAENYDEKHFRTMSQYEIEQLRDNCKRILQATDLIHGGN
jgi:hypothetical protein